MARDTDADWRLISESEPFYGVLTHPKFLRANLTEQVRRDFFATGDHDVRHFLSTIRARVDSGFDPLHALDFGCGVGRLALAMAPHARQVTGVDVSPSMLAEAEQERRARDAGNVSFRADLPADGYDWVNSYLVFQHILPEQGYELLAALLAGLSDGGVASIHLTAFRNVASLEGQLADIDLLAFDGRRVVAVRPVAEPATGLMRMYDYDMTRVLAIFAMAGCSNLWLEHLDHAGHHAFRILAQKRAAPTT